MQSSLRGDVTILSARLPLAQRGVSPLTTLGLGVNEESTRKGFSLTFRIAFSIPRAGISRITATMTYDCAWTTIENASTAGTVIEFWKYVSVLRRQLVV